MSDADERVLLVAYGIRFRVELEFAEHDVDWLDLALLEVTQEPTSLDELVKSFGMPVRLVEDAIGRLVRRNLLLFDAAGGSVQRSDLDPDAVAGSWQREVILLWQDYATGAVLPWDLVRSWCRGGAQDENLPEVRLRGGPPARTVLEMSDAELFEQIERFRADWARSSHIVSRTRDGAPAMRVRALRRVDGRIQALDSIPPVLDLSWRRRALLAGGGGAAIPEDSPLPPRWDRVVGRWAQSVHDRLRAIEAGAVAGARLLGEPDYARLVSALERFPELRYEELGSGTALTTVRQARRRVVCVVSERHGTVGSALGMLRGCLDGVERILVFGGKPTAKQAQRARDAGVRLLPVGRCDADFLLVDDRILCFGATHEQARRTFAFEWRRSLLPYVAWLAEHGIADAAFHHGESAIDDQRRVLEAKRHQLVREVTFLGRELDELEQEVHRSATRLPVGRREREEDLEEEARARESAAGKLRTLLAELDHEILGVSPSPQPTFALGAEDVAQAIEVCPEEVRVIVRDAASPLVAACRGTRFATNVIVWSSTRPTEDVRWLAEPGPADVVLLGDVVVIGTGSGSTGSLPSPPFLALYDTAVAARLRALTNDAPMVTPAPR